MNAGSGWGPELMCIIDMNMSVSRNLMLQTHGNGKGILRLDKGLEECQRSPLVHVWMLTFYAEIIVLWDDSNLTRLPYRDSLLRSFTCLPIYTVKCADFGGCCWCISVRVHDLPKPNFSGSVFAGSPFLMTSVGGGGANLKLKHMWIRVQTLRNCMHCCIWL